MTAVLDRPAPLDLGTGDGGLPARRAVSRWAWRLFRSEWRQQLLVLALIVVAVAATVVGAAVATNTPPPAGFGFGSATAMGTLSGSPAQIAGDVARLHQRFGPVDVIENQALRVPGSISSFDLRAQDPHGPYGGPMLSLVGGHYPAGAHQVAMTAGLLSELGLSVGDTWHQGGTARRVVGVVQNPQSLLDEFALVVPGAVHAPTQVTALFDASRADVRRLGPNFASVAGQANTNFLNPNTIVVALATVGMLLIALVAVGGFTVLAQRRMRAIGMLASLGATDRNLGSVVRVNGLVVGVTGTVGGVALGFAAWLAYRPHLEQSAHHLVGVLAMPWAVIGIAMVLAVVATYLAATRPARAITRIPIVAALSGRPASPRQVHRSAVPGVVVLVVSFLLVSAASAERSPALLVFGLVAVVVAVILLAPFVLSLAARLAGHTPIAARLATRDLARYRARSGSALSAIAIGVLIAVIICVAAAARYGNVLDWAGPNLASNQVILYSPYGGYQPGPSTGTTTGAAPERSLPGLVDRIAAGLGAPRPVTLELSSADMTSLGPGRRWNGPVFVGTPALLRAFGIPASSIDPKADVLSARPGLDGVSGLALLYGNVGGRGGALGPNGSVLRNPVVQEVAALPAGTSAPNTVVTEHAVRTLGLAGSISTVGWLLQTAQPLSASQLDSVRAAAANAGMSVESKNDQPTSSEIIDWATVFGVVLALGILAMTVGLIRSETSADLRVLAATGAGSSTRRSITAVTAGALALLGAVVGTAAGYVVAVAFFRSSQTDGLSELGNVPLENLALLVIGMPVVAFCVAWLVSGRQPSAMTQRPLE